eukprot:1140240-Pelagomonas_calceolata.AAC.5
MDESIIIMKDKGLTWMRWRREHVHHHHEKQALSKLDMGAAYASSCVGCVKADIKNGEALHEQRKIDVEVHHVYSSCVQAVSQSMFFECTSSDPIYVLLLLPHTSAVA